MNTNRSSNERVSALLERAFRARLRCDAGEYVPEAHGDLIPLADEIERLRAENDKLLTDFLRYRQALYRANGFLIMRGFEPVKLKYPMDTCTDDKLPDETLESIFDRYPPRTLFQKTESGQIVGMLPDGTRIVDKIPALAKFDGDGDGKCRQCRLTYDMHAVGDWCPDRQPEKTECSHVGSWTVLACVACGTILETSDGLTEAGKASLKTGAYRDATGELVLPAEKAPAPLKCKCGKDLVPYAGCPACDVPAENGRGDL